MTLLGIGAGFSLGVNTVPKLDCSLDEMIKSRARETQQVRQAAVRSSKRNEKFAARRGLNVTKSDPMQIEKEVQKEMNTRAVRKAKQVIKATSAGPTAGSVSGRKKKKPTTTPAQNKVIRQIKQDGRKAAQQLNNNNNNKKPNNNNNTAVVAALQPTKKALKAARSAFIENGVEIPRGYRIQIVPPPSAPKKPQVKKNANAPTNRNAAKNR